jgi:hypothetical protein
MMTSLPSSPEPNNITLKAVDDPGVPRRASKGAKAAAGDAFDEKGGVAIGILVVLKINDVAPRDISRYEHRTPWS